MTDVRTAPADSIVLVGPAVGAQTGAGFSTQRLCWHSEEDDVAHEWLEVDLVTNERVPLVGAQFETLGEQFGGREVEVEFDIGETAHAEEAVAARDRALEPHAGKECVEATLDREGPVVGDTAERGRQPSQRRVEGHRPGLARSAEKVVNRKTEGRRHRTGHDSRLAALALVLVVWAGFGAEGHRARPHTLGRSDLAVGQEGHRAQALTPLSDGV